MKSYAECIPLKETGSRGWVPHKLENTDWPARSVIFLPSHTCMAIAIQAIPMVLAQMGI